MDHFGKRYILAQSFRDDVSRLRIVRGYVGDSFLENLERARLVVPKLRIRYPDKIARRWWLDAHPNVGAMSLDVEPEGPRLAAAADLEIALHRRQHQHVYGRRPHPLDDLDPRFAEFVHQPSQRAFVPWSEFDVDVSNSSYPKLYDSRFVQTLYSSWQVLQVAEMTEMGVHILVNLAEPGQFEKAMLAGRDGNEMPTGPVSVSITPIHLLRDFGGSSAALDAVVWFAEESSAALHEVSFGRSGRFQLSSNDAARYRSGQRAAAFAACDRFQINGNLLIKLAQFLGERWHSWETDGRPLIAEEYKRYLRETVLLAQLGADLAFETVRAQIGLGGGSRTDLLLDAAFPDWVQLEKERVRTTLDAMIRQSDGCDFGIGKAEIDAFVDFMDTAGIHSFFWRLRSFEGHALNGNEFALEGMRSELQSMAVVIEHVVRAIGGEKGQLYAMFKKLWKNDPAVAVHLARADKLARQDRPPNDWPAIKAEIRDLARSGPGGQVASDLVMAHRIRGAVHYTFVEEDPFELEGLFVGLMRAALVTFVHYKHSRSTVVT